MAELVDKAAHEGFGSKDVSSMGVFQTDLTTIELGLAPFIPVSRLYEMRATHSRSDRELGASKKVKGGSLVATPMAFKFMPHEYAKDEKWLEELQAWQDANFQPDLNQVADDAPGTNLASARLAMMLSKILDGAVGGGAMTGYTSTVAGELSEQALARNLRDELALGRGSGLQFSPTMDARLRKVDQHVSGRLSKETFDLVVETDNEQEIMEYTLHSLASTFNDEDFVRNVKALETTNMRTSKMFQGLARDVAGKAQITAEQVRTAVVTGVDQINAVIGRVDSEMGAAYKQIKQLDDYSAKTKGSMGSYDSAHYMGRQIIDRVQRLTTDWIIGAEDEDIPLSGAPAYIFEHPVNNTTTAYITLWADTEVEGEQIHIGRVHADVRFGSTDLEGLVDSAGNELNWLRDYFEVIPEAGAGFTASHYNVMLVDAVVNRGLSQSDIERISYQVGEDYANSMAMNDGNRHQLIGAATMGEVYSNMSSALGDSVVVSAAEVLSTQEIAAELQRQIFEYFNQPHIQSHFASIYEQATSDANSVTDMWKSQYQSEGAFGPPYMGVGSKDMMKSGMGFWLTMGRDPIAYKLFRDRHSKSAKDFADMGMRDPRETLIRGDTPGGKISMPQKTFTPKETQKYAARRKATGNAWKASRTVSFQSSLNQ